MGQRGPIKRSRHLRAVKGGKDSGEGEKPQKPSKVPKTRPAVPVWLPIEAKRLLRWLIPELDRQGMVSQVDGPGLAALAVHYTMLARAVEAIEADGIRVKDDEHKAEDGTPVTRKHPLLAVVTTQSEKLNRWAKEYGMTYAARVRLLDDVRQPKLGGGKLGKYVD